MKKRLALFMALVMVIAMAFTACSGNTNTPATTPDEGTTTPDEGTTTPDEGTTTPDDGASDEDVIKIGVFEPLTGADAAGGQLEYDGIKAAHSIVNEVLGKKIVLVPADSKSDPVEAATAASRLVESEKVDVVLGSWGSSYAIAGGAAFKNAQTPAIGTSCTNPQVTLDNEYYFRVAYLDDFQGTLLANYAVTNLGAKKAGIIVDVSDNYAIGLRKYFVEAFTKLTGDENAIVAEAKFNKGDQDFSAQITSVMQAGPDVIFAPSGYTEAGLMMLQAKQNGYEDIVFLGGDTWETAPLIEVGGEAAEMARFTTFFDVKAAATPEALQFVEAHKALFDGAEPLGAVTALAYDAYMAAVKAIEIAGTTDGPAVRDALASLSMESVCGPLTFDENGDAVKKTAVVKTVKDGEFVYLDTVTVE